ncbi:MAG: hypothetical protein ACJ8HI_22870 [Massilia sp.]
MEGQNRAGNGTEMLDWSSIFNERLWQRDGCHRHHIQPGLCGSSHGGLSMFRKFAHCAGMRAAAFPSNQALGMRAQAGTEAALAVLRKQTITETA